MDKPSVCRALSIAHANKHWLAAHLCFYLHRYHGSIILSQALGRGPHILPTGGAPPPAERAVSDPWVTPPWKRLLTGLRGPSPEDRVEVDNDPASPPPPSPCPRWCSSFTPP
ncbi:unnamed protein product [Arctogadus glacialis]